MTINPHDNVHRFNPVGEINSQFGTAYMEYDVNGEWVHYDDYTKIVKLNASLIEKVKAAEAAASGYKEAGENLAEQLEEAEAALTEARTALYNVQRDQTNDN